jgi:hypothetical protein
MILATAWAAEAHLVVSMKQQSRACKIDPSTESAVGGPRSNSVTGPPFGSCDTIAEAPSLEGAGKSSRAISMERL